ncbi:LysM peptidoglycan-binding domain-containing protein [Pseudomonas aeruginosa]|uniref:LysM peptidoglycan-binding domain-containing protein n=1 Tax=Pseudomonas aeruginosa TaxID=287 RepID=UPI003887A809
MSMEMNKALDLLHGLVREVERKTCCHEETHRGGAIWEICDSCGAKWADDEGGKPEFAWPESVEKARAFLATHHAVEQAGGNERAGFEAWLAQAMSHHFSPEFDLAKYEDSGEYRYNPAADYWKAWQARAALARVAELEACGAPALLAAADYFAERAKGPSPGWVTLSAVAKELRVRADKAPVAQAQQLHDLDKQCRDDVARALGLRPNQERGFAWSYLLASIKSCVKASGDSAQAQHSVPAYVSYTTQPAESLAGIALRQLKDESRWVEIRDINAHAFPDMRSHSYYPAGTVIKLPAAAPGKEGV